MEVRNEEKGKMPFAAATYITNDQTASSISNFLNRFIAYKNKYVGSCRPFMIITDGSTAMIKALLTAFMEESVLGL